MTDATSSSAGGAASNVMAEALGVEFAEVDAGVKGTALQGPRLVSARIGDGTRNSPEQNAMSGAQFRHALQEGRVIGGQPGHEAACYGEMVIGNTSSASLVAAKWAPPRPASWCWSPPSPPWRPCA